MADIVPSEKENPCVDENKNGKESPAPSPLSKQQEGADSNRKIDPGDKSDQNGVVREGLGIDKQNLIKETADALNTSTDEVASFNQSSDADGKAGNISKIAKNVGPIEKVDSNSANPATDAAAKSVFSPPVKRKRAKSAFMWFSSEVRAAITREHPEERMGGISKIIGTRWKSLSEEDKKKYHDMASKDKERFLQEEKEVNFK